MKISKMTKENQDLFRYYTKMLKLSNKEIKEWERFKKTLAEKMDKLRKGI